MMATLSHGAGSFNLFQCHHQGCMNNPFSNSGLFAACWALYMCHHELWSASQNQPSSFLNSSLGHTGRNHYRKIILSLDLFFKWLLPHCCLQMLAEANASMYHLYLVMFIWHFCTFGPLYGKPTDCVHGTECLLCKALSFDGDMNILTVDAHIIRVRSNWHIVVHILSICNGFMLHIYPFSTGWLRRYWGNHMIVPVPVK